jgi:alkaline phosphatase
MHPHLLLQEKRFLPKNEAELTTEYWMKKAQEYTLQKMKSKENRNVAKNIIMFLGDGMSVPTVAAARVYQGGEEEQLAFEKFPYTGMSKVR